MDSATRQELYDKFDSKAYVRNKTVEGWHKLATDFLSNWLYSVFTEGKIAGETLLDIGTGPNLNNVIYAAPHFPKVYLSDFSKNNREFLQQWRNGEHSELLQPFLDRVKLEGNNQTAADKEEGSKSKIMDVLYCDITHANPLKNNEQQDICQFDAVTISWCVDSATETEEEYKQAIKNIVSLIKPGGHLILMDIQNTTDEYQVNGITFPGSRLRDCNIKRIIETVCPETSFCSTENVTSEDGKLKTNENNLPPEGPEDSCTRKDDGEYCFLAGDVRANEQPGLASMHTIFLRGHNKIAEKLKGLNAEWDDEKLFQEARKIIGALMQHITYTEFLPPVLGKAEMKKRKLNPTKSGYNTVYSSHVDAGVLNEFSTAAFRFGHSLIRGLFTGGAPELSKMFFRPSFVSNNKGKGMDHLLEGLRIDRSQQRDELFSSDVSDKLFQDSPGSGLDLVALNIQRGRDHGIPSYDKVRHKCGLPTDCDSWKGSWNDLPNDVFKKYKKLYKSPEDIDLFSAGISEKNVRGGIVGPTFSCILGEQFSAFMKGDRFWYEREDEVTGFTIEQLNALKKVKLAKIICENSEVKEIQENIFFVESPKNPKVDCSELESLDLGPWEENNY